MHADGIADPPAEALEQALAAGRALGPACHATLDRQSVRRSLGIRLARGQKPEDALTAVLARRARRDSAVAGELLHGTMEDLLRFGSLIMPSYMRRLHDPDDLVVSVLGDCFRELFEQHIGGREELLVILRSRMRWKSRDRGRSMLSLKRREDLRCDDSARAFDEWSAGPSLVQQVAAREELREIALRLRQLSGRDRTVLAMHLAQRSVQEIADRVQVTPDAARRIVQRLVSGSGRPE